MAPAARNDPIAILGGGLSGLSFAHFCDGPAVIFEKEDRLGGLCRSFDAGGVVHDIGPHIAFSKNAEALNFLTGLTPMHQRRRSNRIFYAGRFIKYPFENELSALPQADRDWCLSSFLNNPYADYPAGNMLAFFYKTFGEGITRAYLEPYNRKIWKFEPMFMDLQMVERIPKPPAQDIIASAAGKSTEGYLHQLFFSYPDRGGTESMIRGLAERCGDRLTTHLNSPVERVAVNGDGTFQVTAGGVSHQFRRLVSTMPIGDLIARLNVPCPPDVQAAVDALRFNSIHITIVVATQDNIGDNFAVMVPDSSIMFHRLSKLDFLGDAYHQPGTTTLMAETTFRPGDRFDLPGEKISESVVADLDRIGFVPAGSVRRAETRSFKHAYVVYDLNHRANADKALAWLRSLGIESFGRFGSFEYMNMDAAVWQAREKALAFRG